MPRLRDLDARFLKIIDDRHHQMIDSITEAQGVLFQCPKCYETNKGPIGTHYVLCWFKDRGVEDSRDPKPGRWRPQGTGLDDLTFVGPDAFSVQLLGGCNWHGFVTNGSAA